jgi:hypothetical protein
MTSETSFLGRLRSPQDWAPCPGDKSLRDPPESTIKNICVKTVPSLIPGPSKLLTSEGTGAHHLSGDAIRAAESAHMLSSRKGDGELGIPIYGGRVKK